MSPKEPDTALWAKSIGEGDRRTLARAITLVESRRSDHRRHAEALLQEILPRTGGALRLGITGVPGVGKSTFIEAFGLYLIERGLKLAVLAIDPSSKRGGGSILGDKTRMQDLSRRTEAFIRPSPAGETLGGVARRTREAVLLCEAAGFDVVLVETVGVGQSETAVAGMVDLFLLLLHPGGGDELQGFKRGIMELADIVVVNKADGDLAAAAGRAAAEYRKALQLMRPRIEGWKVPVLTCSALQYLGIEEIWANIGDFRDVLVESGDLQRRRASQARDALWDEIGETLLAELKNAPALSGQLPELERRVAIGQIVPSAAARRIVEGFLGGRGE